MNKPDNEKALQLFKFIRDVNNNHIINHIREVGDQGNKQGQNDKLKSGNKSTKDVPGKE